MGKLCNLVLFLLSLFIFARIQSCFCSTTNLTAGCVREERDALQKFKESLSDPSGRLSSWRGYNCCKWRGVFCNATTGHVVKLDLRPANFTNYLNGSEVDPSLMGLTYLNYLDLSGNSFSGSPIPEFLGSMIHLKYLNLSDAGFGGIVPRNLGNLSSLVVLDLSNYREYLEVDDITWVSQLSLLQHLDLSGVDLSRAKNLGKVLNMLPALVKVPLSICGLTNSHLSHAYANSSLANIQFLDLSENLLGGEIPQLLLNMTSLTTLDLSYNQLNSSADHSLFPMILWNYCHLETLDMSWNKFPGELLGFSGNLSNCLGSSLEELRLSGNRFTGLLPDKLEELRLLKYLDLRGNLFTGPIPPSLGKLSTLKLLDLSENQLNGTIPTTLGNLFNLEKLDLSSNHLSGVISEAHFSKMAMLKVLSVGYNLLTVEVRSNWKPPFQLQKISINSCPLQSEFPRWLQTQKEVTELDLSNTRMSGTLPEWLHYLNLTDLNLSSNLFSGPLPHNISEMMPGFTSLLLQGNHLNGAIPNSLCKIRALRELDLSRNSLFENIPDCWNNLQELQSLKLSSNRLSGIIPNSIGSISSLQALDLTENNLIGDIPDNFGSLIVLKLSSNRLSGIIPNSIGLRCELRWLHLNNNSLSGEIPFALRNCSELVVLDVGDNGLTGKLPKWMGEDLKLLQALRLHNNNFTGPIPLELCLLSSLQVMDLGYNHLTGNIPPCFGNLSGMVIVDYTFAYDGQWLEESMSLVIKGLEQDYTTVLHFAVDMDLSNNKLVGKIPDELANLSSLIGLNLSNNYLSGRIPGNIGNMKSLESLDLSNNDISAEIPRGISDLKFLSRLNLSYNNLSGQIPSGTQLQTLNDPSVYAGNRELCGAPLLKKCKSDRPTHESPAAKNHDEIDDGDRADELVLFYGDVIAGFATGFWGVLAILVFKRSWRRAFFNFLETVKDRILLEISLRA